MKIRLLKRTKMAIATALLLLRQYGMISLAIATPFVLLAIASYHDYAALIDRSGNEARIGAMTLREHALKAIDLHASALRQVDRRIESFDRDDIQAHAVSLSNELRTIQASASDLSPISITDPDGRIWASSIPGDTSGPASISFRENWNTQPDQGPFFSRLHPGRLTRTSDFSISLRRTTPTGAFDGVIQTSLTTQYFVDFWQDVVKSHPRAVVNLIRGDGELLARFPPLAGDLPRSAKAANPLMQQIAYYPRPGLLTSVSPLDHVKRIYAYEKIGAYPLTIGYGVSLDAVLEEWQGHFAILCALTLLTTLAIARLSKTSLAQARKPRVVALHMTSESAEFSNHQRLELLGQLAAGVAHDFNNILQAVMGGARLIEKNAGNPEQVRALAQMVRDASLRGSELTQHMLAFVRRPPEQGASDETDRLAGTDPSHAVDSAFQLLSRTLGAALSLRLTVTAGDIPKAVRCHRADLESALINLVFNARDASTQGGQVEIRLSGEHALALDSAPPVTGRPNLLPGHYARISVTDQGCGMSPEILARAGDAFFTTKPRGQGTGLGLAGVRGFVERAGGALRIESQQGVGTSITFWLPSITARADGIDLLRTTGCPDNVTMLRFTA